MTASSAKIEAENSVTPTKTNRYLKPEINIFWVLAIEVLNAILKYN
jgi:hypothetical protein